VCLYNPPGNVVGLAPENVQVWTRMTSNWHVLFHLGPSCSILSIPHILLVSNTQSHPSRAADETCSPALRILLHPFNFPVAHSPAKPCVPNTRLSCDSWDFVWFPHVLGLEPERHTFHFVLQLVFSVH
jgi:hypothetical protein